MNAFRQRSFSAEQALTKDTVRECGRDYFLVRPRRAKGGFKTLRTIAKLSIESRRHRFVK